MEALWFTVVSVALVVYAVRNGLDLGAGVIHLLVARTETERREVTAAAAPLWVGNVVWLLIAAAALYCAFPGLYGSRQFYLAVMVMVGLSILRGFAIEFRNRTENPQSRRMLDWAFGTASVLLGLAPGTAVGYMIRGGEPDWFPVPCGVFGLACLTLESAAWMALKASGRLQAGCRQLAVGAWWTVLLSCAVLAARLASQPDLIAGWGATWIGGLAILALAGMIGARLCLSVGFDLGALAGTTCMIAGLAAGITAGQFVILASTSGTAPQRAIMSALWSIPAIAAVYSASAFANRHSSAVLRSAAVNSTALANLPTSRKRN